MLCYLRAPAVNEGKFEKFWVMILDCSAFLCEDIKHLNVSTTDNRHTLVPEQLLEETRFEEIAKISTRKSIWRRIAQNALERKGTSR